ncbi:MAG: Outer rane lipoprotein carrier protein LolA [Acidobacteriota bacterium]|jgi:outer membrane lipoprotein-sorting protein|nr:Outer rane lipoprotein carrier protein LolA [Acidobacteriota bacterium]
MKRLVPLILVVALLLVTVAVSSPTDVNAQGAGLVSSVLNKLERNHQTLRSLRASVDMVKYNAQIGDEDKYRGVVLYLPAAGRNAYVRVDWSYPQKETLAVADGQFTLFRPRLNMAYKGRAGTGRGKSSVAFEFMNMSRAQLAARYDVQDMGQETLWGGVSTQHVKLVPKGGASFKWAEAWVDAGGMPVQTKVVEKNDDSTSVRLTNLQRNASIPLEEFFLKLDGSVKIVPA